MRVNVELGDREDAADGVEAQSDMPRSRRLGMYVSTVALLSVYYVNYSTSGSAGESPGGVLTLALRLCSVLGVVWALLPLRRLRTHETYLSLLYLLFGTSFLAGVLMRGEFTDILFLNTLLQLPILIALGSTAWKVDFDGWMRVTAAVLILQGCGDAVAIYSGRALWESEAFIGGVGNPSSFGFLSVVLCAYMLFGGSRRRWDPLLALFLGAMAVLTKSLLAVIGTAGVAGLWYVAHRKDWRILLGVPLVAIGSLVGALSYLSGDGGASGGAVTFLGNKLRALGVLFGLVQRGAAQSRSVSLRLEIHQDALRMISETPSVFFIGHGRGLPYWPVDSQLITYLVSFGALALLLFLLSHANLLGRVVADGGGDRLFLLIVFVMFSAVFVTNRILDYFPIATFYFIIIAWAGAGRGWRGTWPTPASEGRTP